MPSPTLTFGFILATLFGAGFHFIFGGGARRLALFLLVGWSGFAMGHIIGVVFEVDTLKVGTLRMFPAAITAAIVLFLSHALTNNRIKSKRSR